MMLGTTFYIFYVYLWEGKIFLWWSKGGPVFLFGHRGGPNYTQPDIFGDFFIMMLGSYFLWYHFLHFLRLFVGGPECFVVV